ncbi:MAG: DUF4114 domain-containing protein, partial [Rhodospirillaceae bacterium]|nr:DUF4114 domain-containing protein [Rhodospirillaceae bacterium]
TVTDGSITLNPDQLEGITITPPADSSDDFALALSATDSDGGAVATGTANVEITAVDDTGVVDGGGAGLEDTAIALNLTASMEGTTTEEITSVTVSDIPDGAVLHDAQGNELTVTDGSITLNPDQLEGITITPPENSSEDFDLALSATDSDGGATAIGTATIAITDVGDAPEISGGGEGDEDTSIALNLAVSIPDATESVESITITNIPDGAILSAGTVNEDGSVTLTPEQLDGLTITPSDDSGADFDLSVTATSGDGVSTTESIEVVVDAVADAPTVSLSIGDPIAIGSDDKPGHGFGDDNHGHDGPRPGVGNQGEGGGEGEAGTGGSDGSIFPLDLSASLNDTDGSESLSVTLAGVPAGAELSAGTDNGDGSWTLSPDDLDGLNLFVPEGISDEFTLTATATATDTDPDTGEVTTASSSDQADVGLDTVAEAPDLDVTAAAGDEDTAIPLDINAALTDTDGSEVLSVTIAGVPAGAELSAGTDNGDGSWTLGADDLEGLTVTPSDDSNDDFDLSITATSTELHGGDTATTTATLSVDVSGVADAPTLTATIGDATVEPGGEVVEVEIGTDNVASSDGGFTVVARSLDPNGNLVDGDISFNANPPGFGVAGDASGANSELGFDSSTDTSEQLVVSLDDDVTSADVSFAWMHPGEQATYELYQDGVKVGEGTVTGITDNIDPAVTMTADGGVAFDEIVFSAPDSGDDFLINSISFETNEGGDGTIEYPLNIDSSLTDTDGSESLSVTVSNLPEGAVLSAGTVNDDGSVTLNTGDLEGLTLTVSGDTEDGFDLAISATSTEDDGDSATVNTSVGVVIPDNEADAPELSVENATGLEDNAIGLDIGAALTDTDGSETLSVTIAGVPNGAELSAGTDNGDGSWTLTADDLEGLTVTPSDDSNEDFQLEITATSTEISTGDTATETATLDVDVTGVADAPELDVTLGDGTVTDDGGTGGGDGSDGSNVDGADIDGTSGEDMLFGTQGDDTISGEGDEDVLYGGDGDDILEGDGHDDRLFGGDGDDTLDGGSSDDFLVGGAGNDVAIGGSGEDVYVFRPGDGQDVFEGGSGDDTIVLLNDEGALADRSEWTLNLTSGSYEESDDKIEFSGGAEGTIEFADGSTLSFNGVQSIDWSGEVDLGGDEAHFADEAGATITTGGEEDSIMGTDSDDVINSGSDEDVVDAGAGDDIIDGGRDEDFLIGGAGDDEIDGGSHNDFLVGGEGDDEIVGGSGTDTAAFEGPREEYMVTENDDGTFTVTDLVDGRDGTDTVSGVEKFQFGNETVNKNDLLETNPEVPEGEPQVEFPLDVSAMLTDEDGSETLSVTVSGLPEGATLSSGTDNGDGSFTLTPDQLSGLTLNVPTEGGEDFTMTVSATSAEDDGDTSTVSVDVAVPMPDGGASAPTLTVSNAAGDEDTAIDLDVNAALTDTDGSESLSITIAGVPDGASLSAGTDNGDGSWTLNGDQVEGLTITPAEDSNDDFSLTVTATSTETSDGDTASTSSTIDVDVTGVADTPQVTVNNDSGNEDQWIQLHLDSAVSDTDGSESLSISISNVPDGAVLSPGSNNGDGTWSVSADELPSVCILPPADFNGQMNMTLNVTATENDGDTATASETFVVTVDPIADVPVVIGSGSGAEDTAIDLELLATVSGVETVESVTISGVPEGAILSAGTPNEDGSVTLTPDELVGLTITPPADFNGSLEISVSAVSTDGSESADVPVSISVSAVPDVPVVSLSAASGDEDSAISLDITASVPNSTETVESVTISGVPGGASLSAGTDNGDGSWTLSPSDLGGLTLTPTQDLNGSFDLTVSATSTDGGQSDGASLNVDVEPVPESTNLNFTISNESIDVNSESLDLSDVTPDDFGTTDTVEFEGGETEVTYVDADTAFAEFTDAWGDVSDIDADSDVAADVSIANFADVDVDLGDGGDSTVTIDGAAQGDISTGDGDDVVDVDAQSIGDDWSNLFEIDTGDGSDQVTVTGDQGVTEIDIDTGEGSDIINLDGNYSEAIVDAGAGDDVIVGGSGDDVILAGDGDDLMSGGSGSDVLDGGEGTDTLQLSNSYDDYSISFDGDQMIVSGPEGVDTVTGVEMLEFADGTLAVEDIGLEPVVSLSTFGGDEDTAIAIDIGVDVINPFEEVATVSISGVPEGSDLSAGTDNGGGNWTLTAGDLEGLTVTPPEDFFGQLDLSVSATSTEGVSSVNAPLAVDVAPVNDAPVLEGDGTLEVEAGGTTTVTSEDFNVTDVDNDPSEITYTVTDEPDHGTLFLDGEALDEDDIFTQEDVDNGLLQYTADEAGFSWAENTPSWDEGGAPIDQSNLTVPETAEGVTVVFEGEDAGFHNTVGWYKLDENGDPMEPQVLFVDASEDGNTLEKGTEITLEGLEPGEQFGFFVIQDGANKYPNLAEAVEAGVPLNFDENGNITFETSALEGTDDNDVLTGGLGADIIDGGDGDDTIIGGSDDDYLYGGEGDDVLSGGSGDDIIDGGRDDDTLILSGNLEDYIITRAGGTFTIEDTREDGDGTDRVEHVEEFEFADQTLSKDDLRDEAENLEQRGNRGDNELTGTDGDDKLKGDRGDDELSGGDGFDQLDGGRDDDILIGGAGDDEIKGGSGDDTAVFSGDLSDYSITQDGDSFFVSDNRENGDGTDEVKEVESFQFNDQTVSKDDMEDIAEEVSDDEPTSITIEASDIFYTGDSLNPDGVNHAISGTNDDGNLMIGFEDLTGGGDNDFNDVTISVKYEGVDDGASDTFGIKANDGEDDLQENDGTDGGYSVTDGEAAVSVVIDPNSMG